MKDAKSMIKKFKKNLQTVTIMRFLSLILPFLTYTYLFKTIGAEKLGQIIFVLSVIAFFRVIINFGFEISALRVIAKLKTIADKNKYALSVLSAQFIFIVGGSLLLLLLGEITGKTNTQWSLYLPAYLMLIGDTLAIGWYFSGMEVMKYITLRSILFELITLLLTVLLIKTTDNYGFFLYVKMVASWLSSSAVVYIVFTKFDFKLEKTTLKDIMIVISDSRYFFISRLFAVLHNEIATILIGSYLSLKDVAYFDLSKKIISVFLMPNSIINTVIFPYLSRTKDKKIARKIFHIRNLLAIILMIISIVFAEQFVFLISPKASVDAVFYTQILSLLILTRSIIYYTGLSILVSFGYDKEFNKSAIYSTLLYAVLSLALIFMDIVTVSNIIITMLLSSIFVAYYRYFYCKKYKLL
jgi:PST family polysaccharide transporter